MSLADRRSPRSHACRDVTCRNSVTHEKILDDRGISTLNPPSAPPTRPLWMWLGAVYAVPMVAFGWIVWTSAPPNRALRITGALLIANTVIAQF